MLVFLLTTSYPDKENPSRNIFVYEQAKELASRGHDIVVLHIKKLPTRRLLCKSDRKVRMVDDGFAKRFTISQKTILDNKLHSINKYFFVKDVLRLYKHAVSEIGKPDVLYAHFSCWAGVAASRISKEHSIPLVTLEHYGGLLGNRISKVQKKGIEEVISQSKFFLCVSEGLKRSILEKVNNTKDIKVVPNMIDRSFHYVSPITKPMFVFLSVGNLYKAKGFELLISAFIKAFRSDEEIELRIGGGGPEFNILQTLIKENNRSHQIKLLGRLQREQTIKEYINCDCFVLASEHETFGMVYREALITGRPIITTDHGGFSGSDWHECYGYKIPVGDEKALTEKLKESFNNARFINHEEISKICLEECSAEKVGDVVENLLKKAIES